MNADDLRSLLDEFDLTQVEFAHLIDVTPRAVSLWVTGQREIPGPAASYLRLLFSLPEGIRALELSRLKEGQTMPEGMYRVDYAGAAGTGHAVLVVSNGVVFGSDVGGSKYDGIYAPSQIPGNVDLHLRVTVPPGIWLVHGVPAQPMEYSFDVKCTIKARSESLIEIMTPVSATPVRANFKYLRDIPR